MSNYLNKWLQRYLSSPEAIVLVCLLVGFSLTLYFFSGVLAPVITSIILAFVLQGMVHRFTSFGMGEKMAYFMTYSLFIVFFMILLLVVVPVIGQQLLALARTLPRMLEWANQLLIRYASDIPILQEELQFAKVFERMMPQIGNLGQWLLNFSVTSVLNLVTLIIYVVVVPVLTFFLLLDGPKLTAYLVSFLPSNKPILVNLWHNVNAKMSAYIRGKVVEMVIVAFASYIVFVLAGLNYAALLAVLVGVSVIVPYVGALLVTFVVGGVGLFEMGLNTNYYLMLIAYFVIQILDGNVLVPLLFAERVDISPASILIAVLVFGGIWGPWGVFFAIPLATLVKTVIEVWPRNENV